MELQLLRIEWLLMLIPLFLLGWFFWSKKLFSRDWQSVIDPRLLPHLLVGKAGSKNIWLLLFWISIGMIMIFALSGPVWKKLPLPVFKQQSALVIVLDLSRSMNSQDVKPSRLVRARLKLLDLLKSRKEGQTALIVFAATAYTVSPLTDDTDTIQSLVSSLTSEIMPVQGSRTDLAVEKALQLFQNAGINKGDILLISDGVSSDSVSRLEGLEMVDYRLSVLAVGTEEGAPIPAQSGGFVKDKTGSIVIAKTDRHEMRSLASRLGGVFNSMSLDDSDLHGIQKLLENNKISQDHLQTDFKADRWQEEGPWLLLLVTPLVALVFRRGIFLSLMLAFIILPMPRPVLAVDMPEGFPSWESLWKNTNQRAEQSLNSGDAKNAAELFNRADWKAASHYKAGEFEQALEQMESLKTTEDAYNRGNTLAKMGKLEQALESYDEVLKQQPEHDDALFNRKLVEDAIKKQQQQQQQQQENQDQQDGEQSNEDQQQGDKQQSDQENQDQQDQQQNSEQSDQQQNDQQSQSDKDKQQEQKDSQQSEKEKQQAEEEEQAKQQQAEEQKAKEEQQSAKEKSSEEPTESLSKQAEAQWLRRIPDDPGGLLRNKFKYQYGRQQQPSQEKESW
ncbi:MAG: VWA domain-containing protein [Gammaproteobacteria bacterium]|jgi:Ca-activated chloride channel family protein|nr:VWA domain-containing protein [Gammaproteobacteria bacterium]MBT3722496.1 VWA domain-containing protein [Gammaproteobacteria bacterium]MBT4076904.1 VWA domain-containing protein [Gammaproteobacteria bacterium]MBT4196723.1 VWA domain-containing protein [Gammaproteobacteria bacterium]MBT4448536.1 VWA domain-containing protein [Gammaproteobacteria bacterium]